MTPVVRTRALRKVYSGRPVLDGVDLEVDRGEFVVLLGASGTGKTTLLRILAGLEYADDGEVLVPEDRTVVFQEPRLIPSKRVLANVLLGRPRGRSSRDQGLAALAEVGLTRHAGAWPATLSGGEAQRVALARALVREPRLLLLDEPFAALDALTRLTMQQLIAELCAKHRPGVVLVTHDVDEAILLADRILVLRDGTFHTDLTLDLPRPRDRAATPFTTLRRTLLSALGVTDPTDPTTTPDPPPDIPAADPANAEVATR
jgi:sulfonate transport system ATP-binding protein